MNKIVKILFEIPELIQFSNKSTIETQKDYYSPVFINLKILLNYPKTRKRIVNELAQLSTNFTDIDSVCGQESGGNYLSSGVADLIDKPLFFIRRMPKEYGLNKNVVGLTKIENNNVLFVDDVLATGKSLIKARNILMEANNTISAIYIIDYGYRDQIEKISGLKIRSLVSISDILNYALKSKIISDTQKTIIESHVATFQKMIDANRELF